MQFFRKRSDHRTAEFHERREERHSTFMLVEVRNERGDLLEEASLRDLSTNGALVHMATKQAVPESVIVYFPTDRISRTAKVRWQKDLSIGIEFDDPIDLPERMRSRRSRAEVIASHFKPVGTPAQPQEREHVPIQA